jgi:cell division protein FtsB
MLTEDQNRLFKTLRKLREDRDEAVRAQARQFLRMLGDE